ncbi:MAG: MerR family DNA-binding protein [Armatimonadetes bacterium]|nr:MerR family DNA-binding protein [Armatimonadota bacterium]
MTIGEVARAAGVGVETVRFYEREGLVPRAPRTESGYRRFPEDTPRRLHFIRRARDLGFTLHEIGELLELASDPTQEAARIRERAVAKMVDLDRRIQDLQRMRDTLQQLVHACHGDQPISECPILEALESE